EIPTVLIIKIFAILSAWAGMKLNLTKTLLHLCNSLNLCRHPMKIHVIRIILIAIFGIGITACNQASLGPTNNTQDSSSSSVASNLVGEESQEIGEIACVE